MQLINCNDKLWRMLLEQALVQHQSIQLINFDEVEDLEYCEALARRHGLVFSTDPVTGYGLFRRKS